MKNKNKSNLVLKLICKDCEKELSDSDKSFCAPNKKPTLCWECWLDRHPGSREQMKRSKEMFEVITRQAGK